MTTPKKTTTPAPAAPKKPSKGVSASASNVLRGVGGIGGAGGMGSISGMPHGPGGSPKPGQNTHSPFNSGAMQANKAQSQNTKANTIQARKAPGA